MEIGKLLRDIPVTEAKLTGKEVTGITSDSRRVQGGELLICIRGLHHDGHAYAADGVRRERRRCWRKQRKASRMGRTTS